MVEPAAARLGRVRALVDADVERVEDLVRRLHEARNAGGDPPSDPQQMAMAGYVHHAYTGMEACLERIVRELEGTLPEGAHSHRDLLDVARVAIPSVRTAIITSATHESLSRLLSFRHAYRHGYAMRLDWSHLRPLLDDLPPTVDAFRANLRSFFGDTEPDA